MNTVDYPFPPEMCGRRPLVIAGPCSAETEEQVLSTARALAACGIRIFRAGIWKPRTKPGNFEGIGAPGLRWLRKVKAETGMLVATEVATALHVSDALRAGVDILWIGARTTANPFAVSELAEALSASPDTPVLVKNPMAPDLEAWIGAFERLSRAGIRRLGAVHRGFGHFGPSKYRNEPDWRVPIELHRRLPELPILVDPSHIGGKRDLVGPLSQEAMDLGFDGLMVESHVCPGCAWSDKEQQLTPADLLEMLSSLAVRGGNVPSEHIEMLRGRIDRIDAELIDILRRRMETSVEIGRCKREAAIPVVQELRYQSLMGERIAEAARLGLSEPFMRELFQTIHAESVRLQLCDSADGHTC